jgi:glycosyltransferase involved in cell wall biosynthesis
MQIIEIKYFFRKKSEHFHSIENLFANIQKHIPPDISYSNIYLPYHNGIINRIKNIFFAKKNSSSINHITGDINYIALGLPKKNTILTIHDIKSAFAPSKPIKNLIIKFLWFYLPLKKVAAITVISENSKNELLQNFKINKNKIYVIPNCISDNFFSLSCKKNNTTKQILFIGTKENKNLERSIVALKNINIKFIIIGKLNNYHIELLKKNKINYQNFINLSENELLKKYQQADILLFPSLYEGFGMPIVEAQAAGVPVITSNLEPMKSVAGDAAILINPQNVYEISQAIKNILNNKELYNNLINKGLKNAQKYSCKNIIKKYITLYKNLSDEK